MTDDDVLAACKALWDIREKETDNGEMYVNAKQRKAGGRKSGDVEIMLTISCRDLRKPERIMEAIANV
jgi:hypothetical protein